MQNSLVPDYTLKFKIIYKILFSYVKFPLLTIFVPGSMILRKLSTVPKIAYESLSHTLGQ